MSHPGQYWMAPTLAMVPKQSYFTKEARILFISRIKKGEGSLHLRPKGRSIRDPPHSLCNKYIEKEFEQNLTNPGDLPEDVLGILALLGTAANIMIKETDLAAFSGRAGEFMFTLVYDPFEKIDEENYKSAIKDIIKK